MSAAFVMSGQCAYNMEGIVIFDIPRSRIDTMDHIYGVIENFLNGKIFVGKYQSHTMCIKPPHVIVFSNDPEKRQNDKGNLTLSADRWNIVDLTNVDKTTRKRSRSEPRCEPLCRSTHCEPCMDHRRVLGDRWCFRVLRALLAFCSI